MLPFNIGPGELIIILAIALVVFGPGKLPEIGSAVGKSLREFRKAASDVTEATRLDASPPATSPAPAAPAAAASASPTATSPADPASTMPPAATPPAAGPHDDGDPGQPAA